MGKNMIFLTLAVHLAHRQRKGLHRIGQFQQAGHLRKLPQAGQEAFVGPLDQGIGSVAGKDKNGWAS